jgi:integrase
MIVREKPPPSFTLIYYCARGVCDYGPARDREWSTSVVRAWVLELRYNRALAPPRQSQKAMTATQFLRMIRRFSRPSHRPTDVVARARHRAALKLTWWTGLSAAEISKIKQAWLQKVGDDYVLKFQGRLKRARKFAIPRSANKDICAARELDAWLRRLPHDPHGYLFPQIDRQGNLHTDVPAPAMTWSQLVKVQMEALGIKGYNWTSIRISFLKRTRDERGILVAFILSGLSRIDILHRLLRREPDWSKVRTPLVRPN